MLPTAIADDLSGATEIAAAWADVPDTGAGQAWAPSRPTVAVSLGAHAPSAHTSGPHVLDSNNRSKRPESAAAAMSALLSKWSADGGAPLFLKFDSLLRGNLAHELRVARNFAPVVFCPAVPSNRRTVVDGVLFIGDQPLHSTSLWQAEPAAPAATVAGQFAGVKTARLSLASLRAADRADRLERAAADDNVVICDAENDSDLALLAEAAGEGRFILAGAAGLGLAWVHQQVPPEDRHSDHHGDELPVFLGPARNTLFILGSASEVVRRQALRLEEAEVAVVRVGPGDVSGLRLPRGCTAAVVLEGTFEPDHSVRLERDLAELAAREGAGRHLVLSGGATARAALDELRVTELVPLVQAHPGAVVSLASDGRLIATRPGSYGSDDSLTRILQTINALQNVHFRKGVS
ncbi:four-carbon acid sugar kinase family protein [Arthrobacter sp. VKM Ac-2550]|uniref:four-carbon acid sugar kinase family protein n=1 Tax=Crystallibacter permensis TaxID=1938888 RepID=UPI0022269A90|nr:four-carbon acid sugar kinase family protein [Arthrobacter sp. VKM Ac-2550]MCW2130904.1 Uncharacterized conserved protein YgbK, DUF1537 family [Arthrobacter sp. VKM Ac-2550]